MMKSQYKTTDNKHKSDFIWKCLLLFFVFIVLSTSLGGCAKTRDYIVDIFKPERIVPVFDPNATITPQTGTVIYKKNGIVAMAVPLHDVKNLDAFAILISNKTDHWITYKREDCQLLDQTGNMVNQVDKSKLSFHLPRNFKPKLPPEFAADVFRYDKTIRIQGDAAVLPTEDYKKTNVMPKNQSLFLIYFPKRSTKSNNLRIIVPGVTSDFNEQQTTFVFKFRVQRG